MPPLPTRHLFPALMIVAGLLLIAVELSKDRELRLQFTWTKWRALAESSNTSSPPQISEDDAAAARIADFFAHPSGKFISLALHNCAGLCNVLYRFFSIYGIGRSIGRTPFFDERLKCIRRLLPELQTALPFLYSAIHLKLPKEQKVVPFGLSCCRYDHVGRLKAYDQIENLVVRGNLLQAFQYFHRYKPEVRRLMRFGAEVRATVQKRAAALFGNDSSHKLCVHTRVGDFKRHFLLESRLNFANPALQFVVEELEKQFGGISVVLLGLDEEFVRSIDIPPSVVRTFRPQNGSRFEDLHFGSVHCDSLLLTASGSTFGWWTAYLMAEEKQARVFYNIETAKKRDFGKNVFDYDTFPHEWKRLRLGANGTVAFEPRWHFEIVANEEGVYGGSI